MNQREIQLNNKQLNIEGCIVEASGTIMAHYTNIGRELTLDKFFIKHLDVKICNHFKDAVTKTLKEVVQDKIQEYLDLYFDDIEHEAATNQQDEARDNQDNLRNWEFSN